MKKRKVPILTSRKVGQRSDLQSIGHGLALTYLFVSVVFSNDLSTNS